VSWEATSFLLLGLVLLGGFAWYERTRPASQVVALVAALAALAVAGRVAVAAIPNLVATTDIVIFAGYALGPAPGFAVGALAGLVSNFWLGQGPWTPWQMAGWGMCGVLGAALSLGGRRPGRLTLAAVCGFAGLAYGALMNFSLMATYGGDLSMQRFLALEARAIPFDAMHMIGNVTLALVAGPAMLRMLARFRDRFQWRVPTAAAMLLVALAAASALPARAQASGAESAARWLISVQNSDGGWGASPESDSSAAISGWVMLGLEASGRNPVDITRNGHSPVGFLRDHVDELSSSGDFARTILALEGAGVDPRSFGERNLVAALVKRRRVNGSFEDWPGSTAFGVIALRAAEATGGLNSSLSWLGKAQNDDGGWGDLPASPSTADGTGAVMQAMPDTTAAHGGLGYLRKAQRPSGGFALGGSGDVNSQSTAWAVQGMLAVGADPAGERSGGKSALDYLAARQASDGHYRYSASSDQTQVWVTGQVLAATAGDSFPISPVPRSANPSAPPASALPGYTPNSSSPSTSAPTSPSSTSDILKGLRESGSAGGAGDQSSATAPSTSSGSARAPSKSDGAAAPGASAASGSSGTESDAAPAAEHMPPIEPFTAGDGPGPAPWAPLAIGLLTAGLALGSVVFLGRRFGW
jgi:energy-coupling factor transport system substrate-specific component